MPTEYRQIQKAPLYEISKDGEILKISNKSVILPYPLNSNHVKLLVDGERKSFLVDELLKEVWDMAVIKTPEKKEENGDVLLYIDEDIIPKPEQSERAKDTAQFPSSGKIASVKEETKSNDDKSLNNIMKMDCKMSIKIWKLHEAGLKEDEIKKIVKHPYSVSVHDTIERYKNKPTLRERAGKVKA